MEEPEAKDVLSRLVRLETKVCLKFEEMEKAVVLARELIVSAKEEAKDIIEHRLEVLNQHQRRMDRLEATFATKDFMANELKGMKEYVNGEVRTLGARIDALSKLVYIGLGIVIAFQLVFKFFIK